MKIGVLSAPQELIAAGHLPMKLQQAALLPPSTYR